MFRIRSAFQVSGSQSYSQDEFKALGRGSSG